eukprot:4982871-Prorocentrum_lima.AAC.1
MVLAEALEDDVYTADCLVDLPSQTPQLLGLLVDVAVDQLVHEHNLTCAERHTTYTHKIE